MMETMVMLLSVYVPYFLVKLWASQCGGSVQESGWKRPSVGSTTGDVRAVFHLKSGIKVTGGTGTESDPYTLGT